MRYIAILLAALFAASVNMAPAMADSDKKGYEKSEKHEKGETMRDKEHSQRESREMDRNHESDRERDADREHRESNERDMKSTETGKKKSGKEDDEDEKNEPGWWPF